jgi:hypothetical protein
MEEGFGVQLVAFSQKKDLGCQGKVGISVAGSEE